MLPGVPSRLVESARFSTARFLRRYSPYVPFFVWFRFPSCGLVGMPQNIALPAVHAARDITVLLIYLGATQCRMFSCVTACCRLAVAARGSGSSAPPTRERWDVTFFACTCHGVACLPPLIPVACCSAMQYKWRADATVPR